MTDHVRTEELIAAYTLDALEPGETLEVSRDLLEHLAWCWKCPRLFGDLRETAGELALAAPAGAITPALHDRVMNAVRAENRPSATLGRQSRLVRALLVASVGVAFGLGGLSAFLSNQLGETRSERRQGDRVFALVNHPSTRIVSMNSPTEVGRMALVTRPDGRAVLIGSNLRLPPGRVFEIWRRQGSRLAPVDTFVPVDGRALVELQVDPERDAGLAVTIERQRVERPTTGLVFQGSLAA